MSVDLEEVLDLILGNKLMRTCSPKSLAVLEVSGALAIIAVTLARAARNAVHLKIILWAVL